MCKGTLAPHNRPFAHTSVLINILMNDRTAGHFRQTKSPSKYPISRAEGDPQQTLSSPSLNAREDRKWNRTYRTPADACPVWQRCSLISLSAFGNCFESDMFVRMSSCLYTETANQLWSPSNANSCAGVCVCKILAMRA